MLKISLLALFWLALPWTAATAEAASEYAVKAAFIHNMVKYVEWPSTAPAARSAKLCLLGVDSFGGSLEVLQGKQLGRSSWEIAPVTVESDLKHCRVLFISASERGNLARILNKIRHHAVLTMGDSDGFAEQGVMVNFYLEQNKVRFEINNDAAQLVGLNVSSQLLKLARIVSAAGGDR